ncbi:MAG TPA: hypothetical protein VK166_01045 [Chitinophagaceae bacterium]|nr:hypothetical protein [Chitinophagaceae bacterium]
MKRSNVRMIVARWFFFACLLTAANQTIAQEAGGEFSMGPRFGGTTALSMKKHSNSNKSALELIGGWNFDENVDGVSINLLWEKLAPLSGQRLAAIIGAGPGFAFGDEFRFGAAGIIGLDWRISNVVNLQFDWQPTWYFVNGSDFSAINGGFTIRYVFNRKRNKSK